MKKIVLCLMFFLSFFDIVYAKDVSDNFEVSAKEAILYNLTDDQVIYEKNSNKITQIASLTKIMTAVVAIENIDDLDVLVEIKSNMFYGLEEYAQAGFKIGQEVSYRELLYGIMLPSGADAVNAVVLSMGTKEEFVELMNNKAIELGLKNTHFDNAIGMDSENNYSTAFDVAKLLIYALDNEIFKEIFTTKKYTIDRLNMKFESTLVKYSGGVMNVSEIEGAKSGFTDEAGLCLASIATINNVDYLLVNLGSVSNGSKSMAVKDAMVIYNYYKDNYGYKKVIVDNQKFKTVKNKFGYEDKYDIYAREDVSLYLSNDINEDDLTYTYDGVEEINYKYQKGDKLGSVTVSYDDDVLYVYDLYLNDELKYYHPLLYILILIIIIFILLLFRILQIKYKKYRRRKKRKKRK